MAILNLVNHVGRFLRASFLCAFLLFFGLPVYGVFSAAFFGCARFLRIPGIGPTVTVLLPANQLSSNLQLCLLWSSGR